MTESKPHGRYLGVVVGGSFSQGVEVRLDSQTNVEEISITHPVVIQGQNRLFFWSHNGYYPGIF